MKANAKARLSEVVDIAEDSNNSGEKAKHLLSFKFVVLSRISSQWQLVIIPVLKKEFHAYDHTTC